MKKFLLTAVSVVAVAAASHALDVSLSGQVSTEVSFDGGMFVGPNIGGGDDDEVNLSMLGNGAGWNYGVNIDLLADDLTGASVELGHSALGQFQFSTEEVEWRRDLLGDALNVQIYFQPHDIEAFTIQLAGQLGATQYDVEIYNDSSRSFSGEVQFPVMGVNVATSLAGQLNDTSNFDYELELDTSVAGVGLHFQFTEWGSIGVEATYGAFSVAADATNGDLFSNISVGYEQDITEELSLGAELTMDGIFTQGTAQMVLRF